MPRLVHATPKYRLHKRSGQAVVTIQGKDRYLGPHGSSVSRANYAREIAQWLSKGRLSHTVPTSGELTIAELISSFWVFVQSHYVKHGAPTGQQVCIRSALRPLRRLYGNTPACQFGPLVPVQKLIRDLQLWLLAGGFPRLSGTKHTESRSFKPRHSIWTGTKRGGGNDLPR